MNACAGAGWKTRKEKDYSGFVWVDLLHCGNNVLASSQTLTISLRLCDGHDVPVDFTQTLFAMKC